MASATTTAGRRATRNTMIMVTARVVMAVAGLVSLPVVYQGLGARAFGIWVLLSALLAMVSLADLGLGSALVREVAHAVGGRPHPRLRAVLGLGLGWAVCLALVTGTVTVAGWPWLARLLHFGDLAAEAQRATLWLVVSLFAGGVELPWRAVLEGSQRYGSVAVIGASTTLLTAAAAVLVIRLGGGLAALAASSAVASAVRTGLLIVVAHRREPRFAPRPTELRRADLAVIRGYGLRVQVTTAASGVHVELDRLLLGGFFGPAVAGGFDLGSRILNLLRLPPGFLLVTLFPVAVTAAAADCRDQLDEFYLKTTRQLALFLLPGAAALMVCADPLVRLWLGADTPWAAANIAILAPCYALNMVTGAASLVSRAEGCPGRETRYVLLSVVLNLALTVPMLWLFGPLGVPLSTAVAVVLSTGYFVGYFHALTRRPLVPLLRVLGPPAVAAVLAGGLGWLAAPYLPDGPGRLAAALAVAFRGGLVLTLVTALLVATGYLGSTQLLRLRGLLRTGSAQLGAAMAKGGDR